MVLEKSVPLTHSQGPTWKARSWPPPCRHALCCVFRPTTRPHRARFSHRVILAHLSGFSQCSRHELSSSSSKCLEGHFQLRGCRPDAHRAQARRQFHSRPVVIKKQSFCQLAARVCLFLLPVSQPEVSASMGLTTFVSKYKVLTLDFDITSCRVYDFLVSRWNCVTAMLCEFRLPPRADPPRTRPLRQGRRGPLNCPNAQHDNCLHEGECAVLPPGPTKSRVVRLGLASLKANCFQGCTCFSPQAVRLIFVRGDRKVIRIRDEAQYEVLLS